MADSFQQASFVARKARQKKGILTPVAQGRSTKLISMIKWTRTSRLSIKISLSRQRNTLGQVVAARALSLCSYRIHLLVPLGAGVLELPSKAQDCVCVCLLVRRIAQKLTIKKSLFLSGAGGGAPRASARRACHYCYRGYSKLRTPPPLGSYSRARPRGIGPA